MTTRAALLFLVLITACSNSMGPATHAPYHDPEIFFHFAFPKDSTRWSHADTAVLVWYNGTPANPVVAKELARVSITGTDSTCAYFLVASGTPMYFAAGWRRNGVDNLTSTIGPFNPMNPDDYDPYWSIGMIEGRDFTVTGWSGMYGNSSRTTSFCPVGLTRAVISPGS